MRPDTNKREDTHKGILSFIPSSGVSLPGGHQMGSDPTAASGGRREGSEWQRSARDEGASAPRIFAGYRNRVIPTGCGDFYLSVSSAFFSSLGRMKGLQTTSQRLMGVPRAWNFSS